MYTATIKNKEIVNGAIKVTVDFSDGTTTVTETCIPQDKNGFTHWVKSRLATFNGAQEIDADYALDAAVDVSDPVVEPPAPTQAEIDRDAWLADYRRWVRVKTTLIDTGIFTGNETPAVNLKNKVTTGFKPDYLNYI